MNFLNCPAAIFNATADCQIVKNFIENEEKCGQKYGQVYIKDFIKYVQ